MPGDTYETAKQAIKTLADSYRSELSSQIGNRVDEMRSDNNSHYLIYRLLGISESEGQLIDVYQNKGRFVYKYAGSFLEQATFICFKQKYPYAKKERIVNTIGQRPKMFEIDCFIEKDAMGLVRQPVCMRPMGAGCKSHKIRSILKILRILLFFNGYCLETSVSEQRNYTNFTRI
jgi:hypothetical protein